MSMHLLLILSTIFIFIINKAMYLLCLESFEKEHIVFKANVFGKPEHISFLFYFFEVVLKFSYDSLLLLIREYLHTERFISFLKTTGSEEL